MALPVGLSGAQHFHFSKAWTFFFRLCASLVSSCPSHPAMKLKECLSMAQPPVTDGHGWTNMDQHKQQKRHGMQPNATLA